MTTAIRFLQNAIVSGNERCAVRYHFRGVAISIYATTYSASFPRAMWTQVRCQNNTDTQTDYFEKDTASVSVDHPLFPAAALACAAKMETDNTRRVKSGKPAYHTDSEIARLRALAALDAEERWCVARDAEIAARVEKAEEERKTAVRVAAWNVAPEAMLLGALAGDEDTIAVLGDWIEERTGTRESPMTLRFRTEVELDARGRKPARAVLRLVRGGLAA